MESHLIFDVSEILQEMKDEIPGWAFYAATNPMYPIGLIAAYYWYLYEGSPEMEYSLTAVTDPDLRRTVYEFLVERSFSLANPLSRLGYGTEFHETVMRYDLDDCLLTCVRPLNASALKLIFDPLGASMDDFQKDQFGVELWQ